MKLSGYIIMILIVGLCFATIGSIVNDFETEYPTIDVNTSWASKYDYTSQINKSVTELKEKFDIISTEEGWFGIKIYTGAQIIWKAAIFVPVTIFSTVVFGTKILTELSTDIGVPGFVVVFAITALLVIIVFKIVAHWQGNKEV